MHQAPTSNGQNMLTFINNNLLLANIVAWFRQNCLDVLIIAVFAFATAIASYHGAQQINPLILEEGAGNIWFDADIPRVFENMTNAESNYHSAKVHPLFSFNVIANKLSIQLSSPSSRSPWVMISVLLWIALLVPNRVE